ncbi:signal peptide, CUB and EGF-like domain-containing protein 3 [Lingula anatina]|uniref:Signal peptide, CUB and EGF-like domain-containing protein 3 n=1 Tax=Lingula anatina TaxID=7574 RepID=A0A1S3JPP8_LINAN|nr:signal peptide, CUB and EGF-like domain-containing protein 3 [Lingula anatina]|eukprot:XP_013412332.1 signal peptide, CUB and EGF-like domain-containing protein 3 [Lingula anatina]
MTVQSPLPALLLAFVFCSVELSEGLQCPQGFEDVGNMCLYFSQEKVSWADAKQDLFQHYWLSGNQKRDRNGHWYWTWDSKYCPRNEFFWAPGEPNDYYGSEDCIQWYTKWNGYKSINDAICSDHNPYICEIRNVDGGWGAWQIGSCSVTCGIGVRVHKRLCNNPTPRLDGRYCVGSGRSTELCILKPCPIHGGWSSWGSWSSCTHFCGGGTRKRYRSCTNPTPQHGGNDCSTSILSHTHTEQCNVQPCRIDGAWADWAGWTLCTRTCGGGTMMRTRTCTNPKPQHGGKDCIRGNATQITQCNVIDCPTCQLHDVPGTSRSVLGPRLKENESVRYYCLPEYKLVGGSEVRTCQANGSLSNEEPKCTKCCGKARYIPNGIPDMDAGICFGDAVTYRCESGYKLSNDTPVTCNSPYEWRYIELPKCKADGNCNSSAIAGPAGGYKACSGSDTDKVCYMHCSNGLTYVNEHSIFECGAKTGWEWKVPMRGGNNYQRGTVGPCEVSDDPAGLLMFLEGSDLTLQTSDLTEALKEEIKNEMMKELAALNICSDPCQIRDIEIETIANGYRRAVLQEKLLRMKITLYAAPPKGAVTTQQSARIELSKAMKLLNTKAAALKQAILSQSVTLHINGTPAKVGGTNLRISRPTLACSAGSIRKAFECFACPEGTYHDVAEKKCASCPFGQYQDERGQMSCKLCPNGTTTDRIGVTNSTQCREYEGCDCGIHPCTLNGTDFKCDCLPGYEDINGTCTDIDECLTDICPPNSRCINKEGSYRCECLPGFKGGSCTDIDECKIPSTCSNPRTQCVNTVGSYDCLCLRGFYGNNCERNCPVGFVQSDSSCYLITEKTMTFDDGRLMCDRAYNGSHLVDIKDKRTYKLVAKLLQSASYWTGLNDRSQEGKFVYSDGGQMSAYSEWSNGNTQPSSNDPTKNCVIIDGSAAFTWAVVDCKENHLAICELERDN